VCSGSLCSTGSYGAAGATRSSDALCSLCPPGSFSNATGATACKLCVAGTYYGTAVISNLDESFHLNDQQQLWTRPAGLVKKLDYNNFENMSAIIAPAGASSVTLQFATFRTELNYDFLSVRSCTAVDCAQTSLLGRYSGPTVPGPLTSSTGVMLIQWTSDDLTTESGWSASWSSVVLGGASSCSGSPCSAGSYGAAGTQPW